MICSLGESSLNKFKMLSFIQEIRSKLSELEPMNKKKCIIDVLFFFLYFGIFISFIHIVCELVEALTNDDYNYFFSCCKSEYSDSIH